MRELKLGLFLAAVFGLLLSACGNTYEADDDTTGDDDTADDDTGDDDTVNLNEPSISAVTPSSGDLNGGYAINIYGANFTNTEDTEIYFDDVLTNLQGCGPAQCTILAPPWDEQESVTVRLINSGGQTSLADGFSYVEDMSALTSYYISMTRFQYVYPDIYKPPPSSEFSIVAGFFDPMQMDVIPEAFYYGLLPSTGDCAVGNINTDANELYVDPMDAGDSVTLIGPGSEFVVPKDTGAGGWAYILDGMDIYADWDPGSYALQIPGGDDMGPEEVQNALVAPDATLVDPAWALEYVSISSFISSGLTMDLTGTCDGVAVRLDIYDSTATYDSSIFCHYASAGSLTIDSSVTSGFSGAYIGVINIDCYNETTTLINSGAGMTAVGRVITSGAILFQ